MGASTWFSLPSEEMYRESIQEKHTHQERDKEILALTVWYCTVADMMSEVKLTHTSEDLISLW